MRNFKFDRNVRFSYFLPYGYISTQALSLAVPANDMSYVIFDADTDMERREQICKINYQSRLRSLRIMADLGYIVQEKKSRGDKAWEVLTIYRLTRAGLYLLTNTPDANVEQERLDNIPRIQNRNKNELTYTSPNPQFQIARQVLYDIASNPDATDADKQLFDSLLLESVESDGIGILATEPYLAEKVNPGYNPRADVFLKGWKLMNTEALFRANGYLTTIDRRHYPVPESKKELDSEPTNVYDFCCKTLKQWYHKHPSSYLYTLPLESYGEQIESQWKNLPAFYPISEIDDTLIEISIGRAINEKKSTKSYRHMCLGVAVGKEKNYIVHHTRNGSTPWGELIEKNTAESVQVRLNQANQKEPIFGAKRHIREAIMICPSTKHFYALFEGTKQSDVAENKRKYRIGAPYESVCIVPVNPSGAMQLRGLLESSPRSFEKAICQYLLQYEGFNQRKHSMDMDDYVFSLDYKGTPVLIAQAMDWQKLAIARDLYEEGRKFYVSCYPEQAKYLRTIMPNAQFL